MAEDAGATTVRAERSGDFATIREVVTAAFDDVEVARLVERIRASEHYVPELALVAELAGEVVGHTMLSYAGLEGLEERLLLLSPLAVRPDVQRRGIGAALTRRLLELADGRGEPLVLVEGIPAYYPRFGFRRAAELGLTPPRPDIPGGAFLVAPLAAYDAALRGRVVYPPAFDGV